MATKSGAGGLVYSVVAIAIIVLIVSTVAVPVIDDASDSAKINRVNNTQIFAIADSDSNLDIYVNESGFIVINSDVFSSDYAATSIAVAFSDNFFIQKPRDGGLRIYYGSEFTDSISINGHVTINEGVVSCVTTDSVSVSFASIGDILYLSKDGDYGFFGQNSTFKLNADSKIYQINSNELFRNAELNPTSIGARAYVLQGTFADLRATWYIMYADVTAPVDNFVGHLNVTDEGAGVYSCTVNNTSTVVQITNATGTYSATYGYSIIAPIAYTEDSGWSGLIQILPILLFLVPVMFAVRMIQTRRN